MNEKLKVPLLPPRNHLVVPALRRHAGSHAKPYKAIRRLAKQTPITDV